MREKLLSAAEAILFSCGEPVSAVEIAEALGVSNRIAVDIIEELKNEYDRGKRGVKIIKLADSYQLCSREDYFEYIRNVTEPRRRQALTAPTLETLSIIAYNQPITRSRIEFIRGVDCTGGISKLLERGLIDEVGRMDTPGKPILYGTTDEFLRCFGLSDISELPKLSDAPQQEDFLKDSEG